MSTIGSGGMEQPVKIAVQTGFPGSCAAKAAASLAAGVAYTTATESHGLSALRIIIFGMVKLLFYQRQNLVELESNGIQVTGMSDASSSLGLNAR